MRIATLLRASRRDLCRSIGVCCVLGVFLAGCGGATGTPAASASTAHGGAGVAQSPGAGGAGPNLAKLGSLTNYAATMTAQNVTTTLTVHSPTDWSQSVDGATPDIYINGTSYADGAAASGRAIWYTGTSPASLYTGSPYPATVRQMVSFLKISAVRVTKGGPCTVAGVAGHTWLLASPSNEAVSETETVCIADQSGALLSMTAGVKGGAGSHGSVTFVFTMTAVGNVPAIPVPSPLAAN